ncbi:inositol monophosphatase family protein [Luteithermobacter gelatinilyticus]|uniref:inositol monophosphatase family protein n=1 Tax=Luteithermobacter gelatinilyticus TaxID=2582913 RepID=UPI00110670FD|nr:inositol monophosphatase family protein [Luteithermobacter gelatinilyticus]
MIVSERIAPEEIAQDIREISHQEILTRYRRLESHEIQDKSPGESSGDLVTSADLETEKHLSRRLRARYPSAVIAGEESISRNPELLRQIVQADLAFLIDPVDGTKNFVQGNPRFALMMAALKKGEVAAAWIYLPALERMAMAERGGGALLNEQVVDLPAPPQNPAQWIAAAHLRRMPEKMRNTARENLKKFAANRPAFCAGYDYIALLEGKKHFSVYFRTLPWDHLPGSFIFQAAGGVSQHLSGGAYTIHDQDKGLISACTPAQWGQVRELLFPGFF